MASATDIITYVGIPLAVLGVLPILYTSLLAVLNARRIRTALLHNGHKPTTSSKRQQDGFTIRSSPMTTLIEVELPKYAVTPFERGDERYWRLNDHATGETREQDHLLPRANTTLSTIEEGMVQGYLRGGSWRAFQWKKLHVGTKLYRIQYVDELREPPAKVDFTELIHYMLDWGVELDSMGWEKLRSGGLWTPVGTVLLRLPGGEGVKGHRDWVLRTSMPDESDGILSLCVRWPGSDHDVTVTRGAASLPPGWGRLCQPMSPEAHDESSDKEKDLPTQLADLKSNTKQAHESTSMRFKIDHDEISRVYWEYDNKETGTSTSISVGSKLPQTQTWFTTAASSLLLTKPKTTTSSTGILWGHETPPSISTFSLKDTIPAGVLVLLSILPDESAPHWTSIPSQPPTTTTAQEHQRRHESRRAADRLEVSMPPAQAAIARSNRAALERQETFDGMTRMTNARRFHETQRLQDGLVSVRMSTASVAGHCLTYLINSGTVSQDYDIYSVTELILYLIVLSDSPSEHSPLTPSPQSQSHHILQILDEWQSWSLAGGMKKDQFDMLSQHKVEFCLAACLVAVVGEAVKINQVKGIGMGKASIDMLECLGLWRKVRLG